MAPDVLQLMPLMIAAEEELHRRFKVCRFDKLADQRDWLAENARSVRAVVTAGHLGISNELMDQLPSLGIVAIAGVGFERVDLETARARGIRVTNTPDVLTEDVADCAIGLMISAMRQLPSADRYATDGRWKAGDMALTTRVWGRRYGIVGLGRIGQAVAKRLAGFGGSIGYCATAPKDVPYTYCPSVRELAAVSDVLILTAAAGPSTHGIVDDEVLRALGPGGFLINVARGSLVDERALIRALVEGRLGGAGLDVFADEPNIPTELLDRPNVVLSPHIGSATTDARMSMAKLMLANLDAFYQQKPLPTALV